MKARFLALAAAMLITPAMAADLTTKAPAYVGYPSTKCGFYYGIGVGGSAGAVNGAAVGTQIVQGDLSGVLGYSCPFATNAFWFAEGQFGINNLNGSTNGLALSGPMVAIERVGAGSPINALLGSLLPASTFPAVPALPGLPAGFTYGSPAGYAFVGIVEQDIAPQIGFVSGSHQWVIAPLVGLGLLTRVNNGVVVDTWAGWQMNSQSFCPNGGGACAKLGNAARVGVALKY